LFAFELTAAQDTFYDVGSPLWLKYGTYALCHIAHVVLLGLCLARILSFAGPAGRPHGAQWTGYLVAGYFTCASLVFFGSDRFRLPFLPWMLIEAAVVVVGAPLARVEQSSTWPRTWRGLHTPARRSTG
jgi:hypothetical protein